MLARSGHFSVIKPSRKRIVGNMGHDPSRRGGLNRRPLYAQGRSSPEQRSHKHGSGGTQVSDPDTATYLLTDYRNFTLSLSAFGHLGNNGE